MDRLSCNVVRDLLPLYAEGLTSEETNKEINGHLSECASCKVYYDDMLKDISGELGKETDDAEAKTVDYLKKSNRVFKRGIVFAAIAVVALLACIALSRGYLTTHSVRFENAEVTTLEATAQSVHLEGLLVNENEGVKNVTYSFSDDGTLYISLTERLKTPFNKRNFSADYQTTDTIKCIKLAGVVIWENGKEIPDNAGKLFASKHSHLGDMSANGETVKALGMVDELGSFTNELQTSQTPYGWTIYLSEDKGGVNQNKLDYQLKYYAAMLIATIDNLGYVRFEYTVDGQPKTFELTESEADLYYGSSVKAAAKTAAGLTDLITKL